MADFDLLYSTTNASKKSNKENVDKVSLKSNSEEIRDYIKEKEDEAKKTGEYLTVLS